MFAVIYDVNVWIPGDERSRTNPGHGYPERSETYKEMKTFPDEDALIEWIRVYGKNKKFKAIKYEELIVEETISFKVKQAT